MVANREYWKQATGDDLSWNNFPDGAFFKGDCQDPASGYEYVYPGRPGDEWSTSIAPVPLIFTDGVAHGSFTPDTGIVPKTLVHPAFPDAATINDMVAGAQVCLMYGDRYIQTFGVTELTYEVYEANPDYITVWWDEVTADGTRISRALDYFGVVPYQDGTWPINHLVICRNG